MSNLQGDNLEKKQLEIENSSSGANKEANQVPQPSKELKTGEGSEEVNILPKIERVGGEDNPEIRKDTSRSSVASAVQDDDSGDGDNKATTSDDSTQQVSDDSSPSAKDDNPAIADDIDLIEKEWVDKAKQIVNQTKADPRQQNLALSKMKADYLKKRFNKTINVENGT